jgi:hypothetical protein
MPAVTVPGSVSVQQAMNALDESLGVRYKCAARGESSFTVKRTPMTYVTVRVERQGETTRFSVRGGGFIVGRLVNELSIAREVARALQRMTPSSS